MTRAFVLTNHKGGVGKSTSATNIALGIAGLLRQVGAKNPRVLLIDTDSQSHATLVTTGRNDFDTTNSLYSVLMAERQSAPQVLADVIVQSGWDENLHVLPATPLLEQAERELQGTAGSPYRLADPLAKIAPHYAAIVIDTRPSFSLMTEMALVAATDAIVPVEPRYLETVGLMSVIGKIHEIRDGWRIQNLRVSGVLVTKMDKRVRGHHNMLNELKAHPMLGKLLCGVIPMNEAVSYAHRSHRSIFTQDPKAPASRAYAHLVGRLVKQIGGA
ncbi:ParA family protein [Phototrophicus methaneseepsis]|uniref:ParA family protein n=1 Tax=Phototrophicus methaneseepsis TaxID=2710758 RepID=A0A7S8E9W1_9CHLR|nr:ParA family protein [Phototrophicus methaneseepsis]QPC83027.1 ParA family protein [Phototrophicus methaneseepsis]